jgi:hypothetical protein
MIPFRVQLVEVSLLFAILNSQSADADAAPAFFAKQQ